MASAALRLPLIFAAATIAAGVLDSFLPLAKGIPSNSGMVLFGAGFGVIESATFALLIEQLPEAKASAVPVALRERHPRSRYS
jgi:hypothetical protein